MQIEIRFKFSAHAKERYIYILLIAFVTLSIQFSMIDTITAYFYLTVNRWWMIRLTCISSVTKNFMSSLSMFEHSIFIHAVSLLA